MLPIKKHFRKENIMEKGKITGVILEYFIGTSKSGKKYVLVKVFDSERNFLGSYFVNGSLVERFIYGKSR